MQEYIAAGESSESARNKASKQLALQVGEAAASGALMGFGFGVIGSGSSLISDNTRYKTAGRAIVENGAENYIIDTALKLNKSGKAYALANEMQSRGELDNRKLGQVAYEIFSEIETKSNTKIYSAVKAQIEQSSGTSDHKADIAAVFNKSITGEKLTVAEQRTISNDSTAKRIFADLVTRDAQWVQALDAQLSNSREVANSVRSALNLPLQKVAQIAKQNPMLQSNSENVSQPTQTEQNPILQSTANGSENNKVSDETEMRRTPELANIINRLASGEQISVTEIASLPEITKLMDDISGRPETYTINTSERIKLRQTIVKKLLANGSAVIDKDGKVQYNGDIKQERRADIVIGLSAAGKSSVLVDPLSEFYSSRVIDSDMAKEELPEFDGGMGANAVHKESQDVIQDVLVETIKNGDNMVWPIVGGENVDKLIAKIKLLKDNGYSVYLHLNELSNGKAIGRSLNRYVETGRFIPPQIIAQYGDTPTQNFNTIINTEGLVDGYSHYSNDVERGQSPRLIEISENVREFDERRQRGIQRGTEKETQSSRTESLNSKNIQATSQNEAASFMPENEAQGGFDGEVDNVSTRDASTDDYFGDGSGDEYFGDDDTIFHNPPVRDIARAPEASERFEAITGEAKTNAQRHILDIAKKLDSNLKVEFIKGLSTNGRYERNGNRLLINADLTTAQMYVEIFKHEFMHRLEVKKLYKSFMEFCFNKSIAFENWARVSLATLDEYRDSAFSMDGAAVIDALTQHYLKKYQAHEKGTSFAEGQAFTYADAQKELIADFFGEVLFKGKAYQSRITAALESGELLPAGDIDASIDALTELAQKERGLLQKIKDIISEIINWVKGEWRNRGVVEDLEYLEKRLEWVYQSADSKKALRKAQGEVKNSIGVFDNGNTYVIASRKVINGTTLKEQRRDITSFFKKLLRNKSSIDIPTIEGDVLTITMEETADKARDNYKYVSGQRVKMSDDEFRVKLNVEAHIDEIAETSISDKRPPKNDKKNHSFAEDGFTYRTAYFEDFDGQYYKVRFSVGHNGTIATVYNVGKIEESVPSSAKLIAVVGSQALDGSLSNDSILENEPTVNNNSTQNKVEYTESGEKGQNSLGSPMQQLRYNPEAYAKHLNRKYGSKADNELIAKKIKQIVAQDNKSQKAQKETREAVYDRKGNLVGELTLKERLINDVALELAESVTPNMTADAREIMQQLKKRPLVVTKQQEAEIKYKYGTLTNFRRASLIDTAVGFILMDRYQRVGDYESAVAVVEKVREFGTASGQQVQIFSILGRLYANSMVVYAQKELSKAFEAMVERQN